MSRDKLVIIGNRNKRKLYALHQIYTTKFNGRQIVSSHQVIMSFGTEYKPKHESRAYRDTWCHIMCTTKLKYRHVLIKLDQMRFCFTMPWHYINCRIFHGHFRSDARTPTQIHSSLLLQPEKSKFCELFDFKSHTILLNGLKVNSFQTKTRYLFIYNIDKCKYFSWNWKLYWNMTSITTEMCDQRPENA